MAPVAVLGVGSGGVAVVVTVGTRSRAVGRGPGAARAAGAERRLVTPPPDAVVEVEGVVTAAVPGVVAAQTPVTVVVSGRGGVVTTVVPLTGGRPRPFPHAGVCPPALVSKPFPVYLFGSVLLTGPPSY